MTMNEWVKINLGKGIDYDGVYGVQCVDLIKSFVKNVLGVTPESIGNAIEYYNKRYTSTYLVDNFNWIDYKTGFVPQKGDICVFTSKSGKGHVSIATGKGNDKFFYSYDQNYPGGKNELMTIIKHTYTSLLGVLRPKNQSEIVSKLPCISAGETCVFTTKPFIYKNANKKYRYLISEITRLSCDEEARLKKGTSVIIRTVETVNKNLWISYKYNGKTVYSLVYNFKKNKAYIK